MILAKNLKYLRLKNGFSQDDIAEKLGYKAYTTIQKWESGVSEPPISKLKELSILYGVNMDSLYKIDLTKESYDTKNISPEYNKKVIEIARYANNLDEKDQETVLNLLQSLKNKKDIDE